MKSILYITNSSLSFSRAHAVNILKTAEAIAVTKNYDITVFSSAAESKSRDMICSEKSIAYPLLLDVSFRKRSILLYVWSRRMIFDILYFRDPFLWYVALFWGVFLGKRVVFEVHGSHEWKWGKPVWFLSAFIADGLVFITKSLQAYYRSAKPSIVTHVRGVDFSLYKNDGVSKEKRRRELGLPTDAALIMYAGSFLWYSWEVLIGMMRFVSSPVTLVLVGAKPEEKEFIEQAVRKEGLEDRVRVYARVAPSLYPSYIRAADILVNPLRVSYPGSVSSKVFEYMAAGKPIVSTKGKAMEEILIHEKNALLVDLSAEQFGKAVLRILNDFPLAKKLSEEAQESARRFTWEARAHDICALLERI